jgi:glycosyltransferase involved in cell wall biosynthesis
VIGQVGRLEPTKGGESFLRAIALLVSRYAALPSGARKERLAFVSIGKGTPEDTAHLSQLAESLGISALVRWITHEQKIERAYNAMDLFCSTSEFGEGFPNVIGEAMACGTPCVVTDIGDSAVIVGNTGTVVPPSDPAAMADAWREHIDRPRAELKAIGARARARIEANYTVPRMVRATETALQRLLIEPREKLATHQLEARR